MTDLETGERCCDSERETLVVDTLASARRELIQRAFWLEWITVAWMIIEAAVAIATGLMAGSISLLAFGLDSVIELASAVVLIWRLNVELRMGQLFPEDVERRASKIAGCLLFALAAFVVATAAWSLWTRRGQEFSGLGLVVTVAAIPIMYFLSKRKLAIADQLNSRAMRADAIESITCGYLAVVVVVGLTVEYFSEFWWVDSVTSLAIVYYLIKEGKEAWQNEECDECGCH
jgi:divalent metal cation (Fe/Co/Zn/Cd) transporter